MTSQDGGEVKRFRGTAGAGLTARRLRLEKPVTKSVSGTRLEAGSLECAAQNWTAGSQATTSSRLGGNPGNAEFLSQASKRRAGARVIPGSKGSNTAGEAPSNSSPAPESHRRVKTWPARSRPETGCCARVASPFRAASGSVISRDGVVALPTINDSAQGIHQITWVMRPSKLAAIFAVDVMGSATG
jgi:hypothetical protein